MSLKGTLATMTLPDLLQWLSGSVKTGPLKLTNGRFSKEILFQGGVIVSSSNSIPDYAKPENVLAMTEAIHKYGEYPIKSGG